MKIELRIKHGQQNNFELRQQRHANQIENRIKRLTHCEHLNCLVIILNKTICDDSNC